MAQLLEAKVKSVLSGDTIILHNLNNPKQEKTLSLAFVSAPRIRREGDEPFAFESRDFLRRLLVGKVVRFRVLYTIPTGAKREYGIVHLPSGQVLPEQAVKEGWLKLREDAGKKEENEEVMAILEKLKVAEAHAKADEKGLWNKSAPKADSSYEISDPKAFAENFKGKDIDAIVEKVLSGDRLIVRLLESPTKHTQTMLLIAGIRAPTTKRLNPSDGKEQPAEPFGEEAQDFIEQRLLQRNVIVSVLGVSPQNQLVGSVKHPVNGSIAPFLLKAGLAKCTDHHTTMLGADMGALRQGEKYAKDNKLGLFKGHVATRTTGSGETDAQVSRVQSADTIFVRNKAGAEKRVNLSSVRQPKPSDPKQAPWGAEAKEFLRKKIIGKHVKVTIDGKRAATEGYDEREMATISIQKQNIGLLLVENGWASVIRHRQDDTDRSPIYDDLLLAEQEAQQAKKGMWADKAPKPKPYVDYSESLEKAKRQLVIMSRQKKVPAVVDFVKSGSRFTVLVPQDNAKLTFVLGGIRAPRSARNANEKSEPFGQEAHDFANKRCLQRDVEIEVQDTDKVGGFIGSLYVGRENFAKILVEEGLASVHEYSAEKSGNANELFAAEKTAKEGRKGMWHDWDPSKEEEGVENAHQNGTNGTAESNGDAAAAQRKKDYRDIVITHIDPTTARLKLQVIGAGTTALTDLMSSFRKFHLDNSSASSLPGAPKAGDYVSAKFSEDGEWYRARIRRNDRDNKQAELFYVDYGNSEKLPWSSLRSLDPAKFGPERLKPQAVDAALSLCQFSSNPSYLADGVGFLEQELLGRPLVANVDAVVDGTHWVTLFDAKVGPKPEESLNGEVVGGGYAMVPRKLKGWERSAVAELKDLKAREMKARDERWGMWEYGDGEIDD
ncbi:hypothetical protein K402DRAFT_357259 [Aulographum hederae CBS 113979]|uniref:Probable endonuclease LCL3 n=1 Tax=Aulographum hederae CBS 113979 TaxID=1176131 RepID=A0A6G1GX12_9PEZI|nr:hypothetical protein K402DRAFT_357259 [Aulographum hederae CBS 113979]